MNVVFQTGCLLISLTLMIDKAIYPFDICISLYVNKVVDHYIHSIWFNKTQIYIIHAVKRFPSDLEQR
jgi:hypothetical protein